MYYVYFGAREAIVDFSALEIQAPIKLVLLTKLTLPLNALYYCSCFNILLFAINISFVSITCKIVSDIHMCSPWIIGPKLPETKKCFI